MPIAYLVRNSHHAIEVGKRVIKADDMKRLVDSSAVLEECQTIVERVKTESAAQYDAARERGIEDGRRIGFERCAASLAELETRISAYVDALDASMVEVALSVVRRIAPRIGSAALVAEWVEQGLASVKYEREIRIRLHPSNVPGVREHLRALRAGRPTPELFEFVEDPSVGMYDCVLETDCAVARTDLESQLGDARRAMLACLDTPESAA